MKKFLLGVLYLLIIINTAGCIGNSKKDTVKQLKIQLEMLSEESDKLNDSIYSLERKKNNFNSIARVDIDKNLLALVQQDILSSPTTYNISLDTKQVDKCDLFLFTAEPQSSQRKVILNYLLIVGHPGLSPESQNQSSSAIFAP